MMAIRNGIVLSSLIDASWSASLPFFLSIRNSAIGAMNPNTNAFKIVTICLLGSDSKVKANIVKMIIVNDGGTNNVEINLANLCEENKFNTV